MSATGRAIERLAHAMAILGGLVLCALVLMTCASVLGRGLNTFAHSNLIESAFPALGRALLGFGVAPVKGDFEIVEAGVAFAIFAFLPICQLHGAHASVDVFTNFLPAGAQRIVVAFWEVVLTMAIALIAWRLYAGLEGKLNNGETTFVLQFPVWWAYGASFVAACVAVLVALYCAAARLADIVAGPGGDDPGGGTGSGGRTPAAIGGDVDRVEARMPFAGTPDDASPRRRR